MQKQLHNNLILRSLSAGIASDKENLAEFYVDVFTDAYGPDDKILGMWIPNLLTDKHPTVTDDDIWVVVDADQDDRIVSAVLLIPQTWRFTDIEIGVGRIELVATHKDYRRQGLVRELFNVAHQRSAELGHDIMTITGIPFFYRQFGYDMAVHLGGCGFLPFIAIPKLKDEEQPKFTLRDVTPDDIPQLMAWDESIIDNYVLTAKRDAVMWEFEIEHRTKESAEYIAYKMIVSQAGEDVGYIGMTGTLYGTNITLFEYFVSDKASYMATLNDVLRGVRDHALANYQNKDREPNFIRFSSKIYDKLSMLMAGMKGAALSQTRYAWYVHVPQMVSFIEKIKPVLEKRLENSLAHRYTGKLHLSFFKRTGLLITFEDGKITSITDEAPNLDAEDATFPYESFISVLFGYRSFEELDHSYADALSNQKATLLLKILFPKQNSYLAPLE